MAVVRIAVDRYISSEFAALEHAKLWPDVWQFACSLDDVAQVGDVYEHRIGSYSVIIVRGQDDRLRAFQNVCLHRGSELCTGHSQQRTELRCPFHRWTWNLSGELREVPSRTDYAIRNEDFPLIAVAIDTWGPLVFVNINADAAPLAAFLDPVPADASWVGIERFRCTAAVTIATECNWKTLIEGFSETYHVQGIHREMLAMCDDVYGPQTVWERHGKLRQSYGVASPRLQDVPDDHQIWSAFVEVMGARVGVDAGQPAGCAPNADDGSNLRAAIARRLRAHGEARGVAYDGFDDAQLLDMHQYNLFPNITVLVFADMINVVRARPGATPDQAYIDMWNFSPAPTGASGRVPPLHVALSADDGEMMGLVLGQDIANFARSQRGLHQPGLTHLTVSASQECRIVNLHRNLEAALAQP